jgi:hypothetical protein
MLIPPAAGLRFCVGFCFVELLNFHKNRCEIPLACGVLERYPLFLRWLENETP